MDQMKSDAKNTYKAAVIGLGFIGAGDQISGDALGQSVEDLDGTHAHALAEHPHIDLVTGSSRNQGRRERFSERIGVDNTYADWREMLENEQLDIVSVATYSPYHAEITIACANAGVRAVLCEKPIATTLADADRMIVACRENGTILAVNHNRRWHPLWCAVRDEITSGTVGEIQHILTDWSSGRLGNVGTHMFDATSMLLDCDPVSVSGKLCTIVPPDCRGDEFHDPGGHGTILFSNGTRVFVDANHSGKGGLEYRITGTEGLIDMLGSKALVHSGDGEPRLIAPTTDRPSSISLAVRDIVECLENGGKPASTGEHARTALETIIAFHVSDRLNGQWVSLPISDEYRDLELKSG